MYTKLRIHPGSLSFELRHSLRTGHALPPPAWGGGGKNFYFGGGCIVGGEEGGDFVGGGPHNFEVKIKTA